MLIRSAIAPGQTVLTRIASVPSSTAAVRAMLRSAPLDAWYAVALPRPMLDSGNLDVSFSGLKTAVALKARTAGGGDATRLSDSAKADIAHAFQAAVVDVLVTKSIAALDATGRSTLVVAGGVGANRELRSRLIEAIERRGGRVFFPEPKYCTDNGAMIAMAGAMRVGTASNDLAFSVRPRWPLQ